MVGVPVARLPVTMFVLPELWSFVLVTSVEINAVASGEIAFCRPCDEMLELLESIDTSCCGSLEGSHANNETSQVAFSTPQKPQTLTEAPLPRHTEHSIS